MGTLNCFFEKHFFLKTSKFGLQLLVALLKLQDLLKLIINHLIEFHNRALKSRPDLFML